MNFGDHTLPQRGRRSKQNTFGGLFQEHSHGVRVAPGLSIARSGVELLAMGASVFGATYLALGILIPVNRCTTRCTILSSCLIRSSGGCSSLVGLGSHLRRLCNTLLSNDVSERNRGCHVRLSVAYVSSDLAFSNGDIANTSLRLLLSLLAGPSTSRGKFSPRRLSARVHLATRSVRDRVGSGHSCTVAHVLRAVYTSRVCKLAGGRVLRGIGGIAPRSLLTT